MMTPLVTTGFTSPAGPFSERPLDLNTLLAPSPASIFFMRTSGNAPLWHIAEGDILVVDRSLEPFKGDLSVVSRGNTLALSEASSDHSPVWGVVRGIIRILRN